MDTDRKPGKKTKITVPTTLEVDKQQLEGDWESGIRFEETREDILSGKILPPSIQERVRPGTRVFVTEDDDYALLHPAQVEARSTEDQILARLVGEREPKKRRAWSYNKLR